MPIFELDGSRRGRRRAFVRAQVPLTVGATFVAGLGLWAAPSTALSPEPIFGLSLILVASALFVWLPWERWQLDWMLSLAGLDVVGVALMALAYVEIIPAVSTLAVFPALWLSYAFGRWASSLAVGSCFFVTLLPALVDGGPPATRLEVASILALPVLVAGLAVAVGEAARQLNGAQSALHDANRDLASSLRRSEDSEHLVRTIGRAVDVAIAFFDPQRRLITANDVAHRLADDAGFSLDREPYAGNQVRRADNKTAISTHDQVIPRALRGDLRNGAMEWVGPPGDQRAMLATARQVFRADGDVWGTLITAHDVTDLARSLQVRDTFIANVSHELRTPLTTIVAYVDLLEDELADSRGIVPPALAAMKRGTARLQARIEELLALADECKNLDLRPVDLAALLRTTAQDYADSAMDRGLTIDVREFDGQVWVAADHHKLKLALDNLMSNALKFTPAPGVVTIALGQETTAAPVTARQGARGGEESTKSVVVTISDTGCGMTAEEIKQAFVPFWRSDSAREGAVQGVGLGLSLVRNIVAAHQGTVTITSEPLAGTHVALTLPHRQ